MTRNRLLPEDFGPLKGVRIISAGNFIAEPFAAHLAAEMGAEAIHVEQPGIGDAKLAQLRQQAARARRRCAGWDQLDPRTAQHVLGLARHVEAARPRHHVGARARRRAVAGKLEARDLAAMGP